LFTQDINQSLSGTVFDGYRIIKEIGRGGMGVVYEAEEIKLDRKVALKILLFSNLQDETRIKRFEREARAVARLQHQNIIPVYSFGHASGVFYYAMQIIEGLDLSQIMIQRGYNSSNLDVIFNSNDDYPVVDDTVEFHPLASEQSKVVTEDEKKLDKYNKHESFNVSSPLISNVESISDIVQMGVQVANTLEYAHNNGVLHRDIKPSNLIVDLEGKIWVADFGVAKIDTEETLSQSNDYVGTLKYMSPERITGDKGLVDQRADIYSLGLTLYVLFTLKHPFQSNSPAQLIKKIAEDQPLPLRKLRSDIPVDLETVVMKSMSKEPYERYATSGDFADDLQRFLDKKPVLAKRPSLVDKSLKWIQRNRTLASTAIIALFLLLIGYVFYTAQLQGVYQELKKTNTTLEESQRNLRESLSTVQNQEREMKLRLYASNMKLANQALHKEDFHHVQEILAQHEPDSGQEDIRGFEWYYLKRYTETDHNTVSDLPCEFYAMQLSPDRKLVAIGGNDSVLRIYDVKTQTEISSVNTSQTEINGIAYSPDGKMIATIGNSGTVKVWNQSNLEEQISIQATPKIGYAVLFSPDGQHLVTTGNEPVMRIWNWQSGQQVTTLEGHERSVEGLAIAPDGKTLATASDDGHVRIWEIATWKEQRAIYVGYDRLTCVDFSPDGKFLGMGDVAGVVYLQEIESGKTLTNYKHADGITSVKFSPDGQWLAAGDRSGSVKYWPIEMQLVNENQNYKKNPISDSSKKKPVVWQAHISRVAQIEFLSAEQIFSSSWDGKLTLWNPLDKIIHQSIGLTNKKFDEFALLPDDRHFITVDKSGELILWDIYDLKNSFTLYQHSAELIRIELSNDYRWLAVGDNLGQILLWDLSSRKPPINYSYDISTNTHEMRFSPDSKTFTYMKMPLALTSIELMTGQVRAQFKEIPGWKPTFLPDSSQIALILKNEVHVRDFNTGILLHKLLGHDGAIDKTCFSRDGQHLATAGDDRIIRIWDVKSGKLHHTLSGHQSTIWSLDYSPSGQTLISGDQDGHVKMWQVETGKELFELPLQKDFWKEVSFADQGRKLVIRQALEKMSVLDVLPSNEHRSMPTTELPPSFRQRLPLPVSKTP
jgi:eukaryotic-like serine/threonine-protein kinase